MSSSSRGRGRGRGRGRKPPGQGVVVPVDSLPAIPDPPRERREGGNYKPAQVVLDSKQTRRTSAQVIADTERAATEAAAAKTAADKEALAKKKRIAQLEDSVQVQEDKMRKNALRPDLIDAASQSSKIEVSKVKIVTFFTVF